MDGCAAARGPCQGPASGSEQGGVARLGLPYTEGSQGSMERRVTWRRREARQAGIRPFCVTVDPTGPKYLAKMYGEVAFTVIDRVEHLPARLLRVYRQLAL